MITFQIKKNTQIGGQKQISFITEFIGDHWTFATNFYKVDQPHILHNDDSVRWIPDLYKTVVIPLEIEKPTNFAVFDQCLFGWASKTTAWW